jgi:hypothetical protein
MSSGCQYKNMFGAPNTGLHSYRIMDIAIVDVLLTLLVAWILSYMSGVEYWKMALGMFVLGIVLHRVFCVRTTLDKLLFG